MWLFFFSYSIPFLSFNPHTHAGCDSVYCYGRYDWWGFNPHTHAGCDLMRSPNLLSSLRFQSTHPRRVWRFFVRPWRRCSMFQSTHPRRVWPALGYILNAIGLCFNPHTHAGCDNPARERLSDSLSFNPHTHAGCDLGYGYDSTALRVSIHTPTQGVTDFFRCLVLSVYVSIHTPTQGVTRPTRLVLILIVSFNPHTHAGCDSISNNIL